MISPEIRGGLWDIKEKTKCNGRKEYEKNRDKRGTQRETTENV
jgi:hypothetical protein